MHIATHIIPLAAVLAFCTACERQAAPRNQSAQQQQVPVGSNEVMIANQAGPSSRGFTRVEWYVPRPTLETQPRWNPTSGEPPLSIAKASSLALPRARERFPEVQDWVVQNVQVHNLARPLSKDYTFSYPDVWYYWISFRPRDPQMRERMGIEIADPALEQIVLLDGSVVVSRVTRE